MRSFTTERGLLWGGLAAIGLSLAISLPASAQTNSVSLNSGAARYNFSNMTRSPVDYRASTSAWFADFIVNIPTTTPDHLFQNGWWFRTDGMTREFAVATQTDFSQPSPNRALLTFREPEGVIFHFDYRLNSLGTGNGHLVIVATITNPSATGSRTVDLFHYHDFDVNGTAGGDTAVALSPNWHRITDGTTVAEVIASPNFLVGWELNTWPNVRNRLTDAAISNLPNTSPSVGPADVSGAFQWRFALGPGQSVQVILQKAINMPPPGSPGAYDRYWKRIGIWCFPGFVNINCSPWVPLFGGRLWCRVCTWNARSVDIFAWRAYRNRFTRWLSIFPSKQVGPYARLKDPITFRWFQWRWFRPQPPPPNPPWDPSRPPDIPLASLFDGSDQPELTLANWSDAEELLTLPGEVSAFPEFIQGLAPGVQMFAQHTQQIRQSLQENGENDPRAQQLGNGLSMSVDSFFDIFFDFQDGFPNNPTPFQRLSQGLAMMAQTTNQLEAPRYLRSVGPQLRRAALTANEIAGLIGGGGAGGGGDFEPRFLLLWDRLRQQIGNAGRSTLPHLFARAQLVGEDDPDGEIVMLHIRATLQDGTATTFEFNPPLDHDGKFSIPLDSLSAQTDPAFNWSDPDNPVVAVEMRMELDGYDPVTLPGELFHTDEFMDYIEFPLFVLNPGCTQPGDANGDGIVNDEDLLIVLFNFGGAGAGDVNNDGIVNDEDLLIVLFNFGLSC